MAEWTTATRRGAALLFLAILGGLVAASPGSAQISPRCADAEYRQLDFWMGGWEVRSPDGRAQGTSRITPIMEGCAIEEEWSSSQIRGRSISTPPPVPNPQWPRDPKTNGSSSCHGCSSRPHRRCRWWGRIPILLGREVPRATIQPTPTSR